MLRKEKKTKVRRNRLKKDPAQRRRRWLGRLLVGVKLSLLMTALLGASALFMLGYAAVTQSDYFRTRRIEVSGNQRLSREEILTQAGIHVGDNLLALNLRVVREKVLAHPWIAAVHVSREIPETIVLKVKEHDPLARVDLGRKFLINGQGRIFKEVESVDPQDLPLVSGIAYGDISLGKDSLTPAMRTVVHMLQISRKSSSPIAFEEIEELRMDDAMGVSLVLKQNQRLIKLGFDGFEKKYERFTQVRVQLENDPRWRDYRVVDLNNPDRVVVRLAQSAQ